MADHVDSGTVKELDVLRAQAIAARALAEAALAEAALAEAEARAQADKPTSDDRAADDRAQGSAAIDDRGPEDNSSEGDGVKSRSASNEAPSGSRRRMSRLLRRAFAMVFAVVLAAGSVSIYLAVDHHDVQRQADQRLDYLQAARQGVLNILTVNYKTAEVDVRRIVDDSTGAWHDEFGPQAQPFVDAVKKFQVVTTGSISGAGLERVNDDGTAQILIAAHSTVSNAAGADNEPRTFRLRVTVAPDGSQLKIAKMEYVPS